jgi:hypothetical protein
MHCSEGRRPHHELRPGGAAWCREITDEQVEPVIVKTSDSAPPERAIVLCVDGRSQIQALDRRAPTLPKKTYEGSR